MSIVRREQVKDLRKTAAFCIPTGAAAFWFMRWSREAWLGGRRNDAYHSLIFGDTADWPAIFQGHLLLDGVACCLFFWACLYSLLRYAALTPSSQRRLDAGDIRATYLRLHGRPARFLSLLCFFAGFGGMLGSTGASWYFGIELFWVFALCLALLIGPLARAGGASEAPSDQALEDTPERPRI